MREFVLDIQSGEACAPGDEIPQIDDPRFGLAARSRSRTVRRTWLDTFDWRLFRAGLTLELAADRGAAELVLTGRDGELVAIEQAGRGRRGDSGDDDGQAGWRISWPCRACS